MLKKEANPEGGGVITSHKKKYGSKNHKRTKWEKARKGR